MGHLMPSEAVIWLCYPECHLNAVAISIELRLPPLSPQSDLHSAFYASRLILGNVEFIFSAAKSF